eukprot:1071071-Prorocentrum_minimum.AAC.1
MVALWVEQGVLRGVLLEGGTPPQNGNLLGAVLRRPPVNVYALRGMALLGNVQVNPPLGAVNPPLPALNPPLPAVNPPLPALNPPLVAVNPPLPALNPSPAPVASGNLEHHCHVGDR